MSQLAGQLVSRSAMGTQPSLDPEYPAYKSTINANAPTEATAVGVKTLTAQAQLRANSPNS